ATNRCAAYDFATNSHWLNSHDVEIRLRTEFFKQFEIATPISSKRPFVSHANLTKRFRMLDQLLHKILGLGGGKLFIESNDQQMPHAKRANQSDFVRRSGKQVRRFIGAQYFLWVWIKCDHHRRTICRTSVFRRSGDHCLMTQMDAIEDADRQKKRARQVGKFRNRPQDFHAGALTLRAFWKLPAGSASA